MSRFFCFLLFALSLLAHGTSLELKESPPVSPQLSPGLSDILTDAEVVALATSLKAALSEKQLIEVTRLLRNFRVRLELSESRLKEVQSNLTTLQDNLTSLSTSLIQERAAREKDRQTAFIEGLTQGLCYGALGGSVAIGVIWIWNR